jgi:RNA polymerase sigma factor (sigma-70 family)
MSMPPCITTQQLEALYREYRPLLTSLAYRMLGSMSEAEDAVQDVFVSVSRLGGGTAIAHPKAYLVRMLTNRVLNMLKAAPKQREHYPGQWLPEPIIELGSEDEPSAHLLRRERLGYAMLVLLQNCTPPERAVFVLRESLGYDYREIAAMLSKSEATCRKIFSRAAAKIGQRPRTDNEAALDESIYRFVQTFAKSLHTGRFDAFIDLLTDHAVLLSDGGGIVRSALKPILGRDRIGAFFTGIAGKGSLTGQVRHAWISGQRGLLLQRSEKPPIALAFATSHDGSAVTTVYFVSNPEKLTRILGL